MQREVWQDTWDITLEIILHRDTVMNNVVPVLELHHTLSNENVKKWKKMMVWRKEEEKRAREEINLESCSKLAQEKIQIL